MKNESLNYADYLRLDKLLDAQHLVSEAHGHKVHDELFFIIIHQTYELWFKQIIAELDSVIALFPDIAQHQHLILSRLSRIAEIQRLLNSQIFLLETLAPMEFVKFRDYLAPASGHQSYQFRLLEIKLGVDYGVNIRETSFFQSLAPAHQELIVDAADQSNLRRCFENWLTSLPYFHEESCRTFKEQTLRTLRGQIQTAEKNAVIPNKEQMLHLQQLKALEKHFQTLFDKHSYEALVLQGEREFSHEALLNAVCIYLRYNDTEQGMDYQIIEKGVEIDNLIAQWRYAHVSMVQRLIGSKMGTGGTSGVEYLKQFIDKHRVFTDLTTLATYLLP